MSEYKPITGEIREQMEQAERIYPIVDGMQNTQVRINLAWLTEQLDAIDAIHAALEADNERLRGEWDYWESTHVELPKDADGEYIHIGDEIDTEHFGTVEVEGFVHNSIAFYNYAGQPAYLCTSPTTLCRHHHAPTVEDVLREFADEVYADAGNEIRDRDFLCAKYAKRLTLAGDAE